MLNIHERRQCGIPVIIEGETGVGKTALIEMLSKLWNHALINDWRTVKQRIVEQLYNKSHGMIQSIQYPLCSLFAIFQYCPHSFQKL